MFKVKLLSRQKPPLSITIHFLDQVSLDALDIGVLADECETLQVPSESIKLLLVFTCGEISKSILERTGVLIIVTPFYRSHCLSPWMSVIPTFNSSC